MFSDKQKKRRLLQILDYFSHLGRGQAKYSASSCLGSLSSPKLRHMILVELIVRVTETHTNSPIKDETIDKACRPHNQGAKLPPCRLLKSGRSWGAFSMCSNVFEDLIWLQVEVEGDRKAFPFVILMFNLDNNLVFFPVSPRVGQNPPMFETATLPG